MLIKKIKKKRREVHQLPPPTHSLMRGGPHVGGPEEGPHFSPALDPVYVYRPHPALKHPIVGSILGGFYNVVHANRELVPAVAHNVRGRVGIPLAVLPHFNIGVLCSELGLPLHMTIKLLLCLHRRRLPRHHRPRHRTPRHRLWRLTLGGSLLVHTFQVHFKDRWRLVLHITALCHLGGGCVYYI